MLYKEKVEIFKIGGSNVIKNIKDPPPLWFKKEKGVSKMLCYICRQRWAPCTGDLFVVGSEKERKRVFESNEIRCCGDPECLAIVDAMIQEENDIDFTDRWIKETKEMAERGDF